MLLEPEFLEWPDVRPDKDQLAANTLTAQPMGRTSQETFQWYRKDLQK